MAAQLKTCLSCLDAPATEPYWQGSGPVMCTSCKTHLDGGHDLPQLPHGAPVTTVKNLCTLDQGNPCYDDACVDCWGEFAKPTAIGAAQPVYFIRRADLWKCCLTMLITTLKARRTQHIAEPGNGHRISCPTCNACLVLIGERWRMTK